MRVQARNDPGALVGFLIALAGEMVAVGELLECSEEWNQAAAIETKLFFCCFK